MNRMDLARRLEQICRDGGGASLEELADYAGLPDARKGASNLEDIYAHLKDAELIATLVEDLSTQYGGKPGVVFVDTTNKLADVLDTRNGRTQGTAAASALLDGLKLKTGWMVMDLAQQYIETNTTDPAKLRRFLKIDYSKADISSWMDQWNRSIAK